jgi:guanylate kinase
MPGASERGLCYGLPPCIKENESRKLESLYLGPMRADYQLAERDDLTVVTISGPSCVGKGPLLAAVNRFLPVKYGEVPVIKRARASGLRPDDNPAHFMKPEDILKLPKSEYLIGNCRGSPQAISILDIMNREEDLVVIEAHHSLVSALENPESLLRCKRKIKVFVSPLSAEDIDEMKKRNERAYKEHCDEMLIPYLRKEKRRISEDLCDLMRAKLDFRAKWQGKNPEDEVISKDNDKRARDVYNEMQHAHLVDMPYSYSPSDYFKYDHIIVNRDGEGHPNWHRNPNGEFTAQPEGDARKAVESLAGILADATGTPRRLIQRRLF